MYHIVICDNDLSFRKELYKRIEQMTGNLYIDCCITQCGQAEQVKEIFMQKEPVDLFFLGIELENSLGFELGKYMREELYDFDTPIVYVSERPEYVIELIDTMPFGFLSKPILEKNLRNILERFVKKREGKESIFYFQEGKIVRKIPYNKILYFQSESPKLLVFTMNGTKEFYGKLDDIEEKMPEYFIRIHKSYIVNIRFVIEIRYNSVTLLDKQKLSISRFYKERVRECLNMKGYS